MYLIGLHYNTRCLALCSQTPEFSLGSTRKHWSKSTLIYIYIFWTPPWEELDWTGLPVVTAHCYSGYISKIACTINVSISTYSIYWQTWWAMSVALQLSQMKHPQHPADRFTHTALTCRSTSHEITFINISLYYDKSSSICLPPRWCQTFGDHPNCHRFGKRMGLDIVGYTKVNRLGLTITNLISFEMTFTYIAIIQDRIF